MGATLIIKGKEENGSKAEKEESLYFSCCRFSVGRCAYVVPPEDSDF